VIYEASHNNTARPLYEEPPMTGAKLEAIVWVIRMKLQGIGRRRRFENAIPIRLLLREYGFLVRTRKNRGFWAGAIVELRKEYTRDLAAVFERSHEKASFVSFVGLFGLLTNLE
jgi:hypothetical protein